MRELKKKRKRERDRERYGDDDVREEEKWVEEKSNETMRAKKKRIMVRRVR